MTCRLPIKPARGTLSALTTKLGELEENEIVYSTDEETLYVVRGGSLKPVSDPTLVDTVIALNTRVTELETALTELLGEGPLVME